ncbi:MAG: hypothetical protein K0Q87_1713 [Neobacillus sp.]|jgi:hypothetical protein|nr:hypothetical protein [Neobacillus sp.]
MRYNEETKKLLDQQQTLCPDMCDIISIINSEISISAIALSAYHLGMINGKRKERERKSRK